MHARRLRAGHVHQPDDALLPARGHVRARRRGLLLLPVPGAVRRRVPVARGLHLRRRLVQHDGQVRPGGRRRLGPVHFELRVPRRARAGRDARPLRKERGGRKLIWGGRMRLSGEGGAVLGVLVVSILVPSTATDINDGVNNMAEAQWLPNVVVASFWTKGFDGINKQPTPPVEMTSGVVGSRNLISRRRGAATPRTHLARLGATMGQRASKFTTLKCIRLRELEETSTFPTHHQCSTQRLHGLRNAIQVMSATTKDQRSIICNIELFIGSRASAGYTSTTTVDCLAVADVSLTRGVDIGIDHCVAFQIWHHSTDDWQPPLLPRRPTPEFFDTTHLTHPP